MSKPRVLVLGGGFSGIFCARDLSHQFDVTVIDAKEFFDNEIVNDNSYYSLRDPTQFKKIIS